MVVQGGLYDGGDEVLDVLTRIDELRRHGLDPGGIAAEMAHLGTPVPAGGQWSAAKVERILDVFDSVRAEHDGSGAPAGGLDRQEGGAVDDGDDRHTGPGVLGVEAHRGPGGRSALRWVAVGAVLVAVGAGGVLAMDATGRLRGATSGVVGEAMTATTLVAAPTTVAPNPADTLAIRVETDQPEDAAPGDTAPDDGTAELLPATATIRTDGRLYVEGAFATDAEASIFLQEAAAVFGRENIVEAFVVDRAAPAPKVADVALDKPVLFEPGTAIIHPDYIAFLEACAGVLELNPHIVMSVTAHTDSQGSEAFNLELSRQRAQAIIDFYRDREIGDEQLLATGVGEADPVASNDTDEGRRQNRRAMLELLNVVGDEAAAVD